MQKVKFGDLTVRQIKKICSTVEDCLHCPLCYMGRFSEIGCEIRRQTPITYPLDNEYEVEIDLPDEGEKQ